MSLYESLAGSQLLEGYILKKSPNLEDPWDGGSREDAGDLGSQKATSEENKDPSRWYSEFIHQWPGQYSKKILKMTDIWGSVS